MAGKRDQYGEAAERLYVESGRTIDEIARMLSISRKTIGEWCASGRWVEKRKLRKIGPGVIVERIQAAIADILERDDLDASAADAIHKLNKTLQTYLKESESHKLTKAIEVMDWFLDRLARKYPDPEQRQPFVSEIEEFFTALEEAA